MNAPQHRLRLLQIGYGNIGMRRVRVALGNAALELVGVVDIKPEQLRLAREVVGEEVALEVDYTRALARLRPDAVIISTPNYLHAPMILDALQAGAHVLCEKPLAINSELAERCVQLARRRGRKLKVGSNHRYWRGVREMLTALESGAIGEVEAIDGEVGYLLPDVRSDWYREKEHSGGGTLIDNSPHLLDVVGQILRVNGGDRIRRARCRTAHDALGLAVEDMAGGELLTERGRRIGLAATWADGEYRMNLTVRGARGRLSLVGFETLVVETDDGATETRSYADTPANESWALDIQAFVEAILFDRAPRASGEEGAQCVRIIEALYASAGRGGEDVVL